MKVLPISLTARCAALAFVAVFFAAACSNPADNAPDAEVSDPVATTSVEGDVYDLAEGSTVGFIGSKVTGSHEGGFNSVSGSITLVENDPAQSKVELVIDATSIWSDNDNLTNHLKSADFFDVENFPTATFESTEIKAQPLGYAIIGNLDLHGVTKSISFPAEISIDEAEINATAEFSINRFDFGIEYPGKADDLIRDEVLIRFEIVAKPAT